MGCDSHAISSVGEGGMFPQVPSATCNGPPETPKSLIFENINLHYEIHHVLYS